MKVLCIKTVSRTERLDLIEGHQQVVETRLLGRLEHILVRLHIVIVIVFSQSIF